MTEQSLLPTGSVGLVCLPDNPLGEIINLIPWEFTTIDPKLLDAIANKLIPTLKTLPSNSVIMMLLESLHNAEYVHLHALDSVIGKTYIIKRI
jgi:hypothetical protein